jgi:hypothetical protein
MSNDNPKFGAVKPPKMTMAEFDRLTSQLYAAAQGEHPTPIDQTAAFKLRSALLDALICA